MLNGITDLYVSFSESAGSWTEPKNMGMDADGSNQTRLTHVSGQAIHPAWKPGR
jgi:hypothetical protein